MNGIPQATPIVLTVAERADLDGLVRSTKTEYRLRQRARIVLLAADGLATRAVARSVGCTIGTAAKWRVRYAERRLAGLDETGNRSAEPKCPAETGRRILTVLDGPPPAGYARWTAPLIAKALRDVHEQYIWRFLRAQKIDLAGRKTWCQSKDPEFAAKAAEIVGLYLDPPEGALVVAVDEKPHIQALERVQGYLKLPNGRALSGQAHDYKRPGTSTLFAALDIANGKVAARHYKRRRRVEFLDFMNRIVKAHPGREIHVILDSLNTHKPPRDRWLARHKNVRFHFTPTHASWLNQIECWFSILGGESLSGASFTDVSQLRRHIDAFVESYNETARPFAWTKSEVHQKRLKPRFADLQVRILRCSSRIIAPTDDCSADGAQERPLWSIRSNSIEARHGRRFAEPAAATELLDAKVEEFVTSLNLRALGEGEQSSTSTPR